MWGLSQWVTSLGWGLSQSNRNRITLKLLIMDWTHHCDSTLIK